MSQRAEIYVSTDVEADGPIPGPHSMLSFASAAYLVDKTLVVMERSRRATHGSRQENWQPEKVSRNRTGTHRRVKDLAFDDGEEDDGQVREHGDH